MVQALSRTVIAGVTNNSLFLVDCLNEKSFRFDSLTAAYNLYCAFLCWLVVWQVCMV